MPRILIVDDNSISREAIRECLADDGYQIDEAQNGEEALSLVSSRLPSLVLLDGNMPRMNGIETLRRLKATASTARVPVIMLTGMNAEQDVVESLECGAADHVSIPFSQAVLRARIRSALRRAPATGAAERASRKHGSQGGTLSVLGAKGGVGASYVAISLAAQLARREANSVNLLEMRAWPGSFSAQLDFAATVDLAPLLKAKPRAITADALRPLLARHAPGLHVLFAPRGSEGHGELSAAQATAILKASARLAKYTIVDLSSSSPEVVKRTTANCDQVLLVVEPNTPCLAAAKAWLQRFESWGIMRSGLSIAVVEKSPDPFRSPADFVQQALNVPIVRKIASDPDGSILAERLRATRTPSNAN